MTTNDEKAAKQQLHCLVRRHRDPIWLTAVLPAFAMFLLGLRVNVGFTSALGRLSEDLSGSLLAAVLGSLLLYYGSWTLEHKQAKGPRAPEPPPASAAAGRWTLAISLALLGTAIASVVFGAAATESLEWDGFVGWELRAKTLEPWLGQPVEVMRSQHVPVDPAVFLPSLQYPLLLPSLGADLRYWFGPGAERFSSILILLLWIGLFAAVARSLRLGLLRGSLLVAAFGLTPMLYSTGSGGADSGYAEILLGYVLTLCAAGLLLRFWPLLFLGSALLIWSKPEGLAYALLLLLVTAFACRGRSLHYAASIGLGIGLAAWLPLRDQLSFATAPSWWLALALPALALLGKEALLRWPVLRRRWRMLTLAALGIAFAIAFTFRESFQQSSSLLLRDFVGHPERLFERLALLPEIALGVLKAILEFKKYGLVFVLLIVALLVPALRKWRARPRSPLAFVQLGLLLCVMTLVFGPEDDIQHELISRFDRLLLHWVGPCWIVLAPWLARAWTGPGEAQPATPAAASGPASGSR